MTKGMTRNVLRRCGKLCALAAAAFGLSMTFASAAHASSAAWMAEAEPDEELIDGGAPPAGRTTWGTSVQLAGPGTLTVRAYDLGVEMTLMDRLDSLSFSVSNSTSILGSHSGDGSMTFDLKGPGEYFVNFAAGLNPNALFKIPLVSWSVSFTPSASQVPLPAGVWLMLAGLAWATGLKRKRAKLALPSFGFRNQSVTYAT
jgi:hypothetical protein